MAEKSETVICPYCGSSSGKEDIFCVHCGREIAQQTKTHDARALALQKAGDDFTAMPVSVKANCQRAIERYDKALEIDPALEAAWIGKAKALKKLKRWREAKEAIEKALALNPRNAQAWLIKGECEEYLGVKSQAQTSYAKGISYNNFHRPLGRQIDEKKVIPRYLFVIALVCGLLIIPHVFAPWSIYHEEQQMAYGDGAIKTITRSVSGLQVNEGIMIILGGILISLGALVGLARKYIGAFVITIFGAIISFSAGLIGWSIVMRYGTSEGLYITNYYYMPGSGAIGTALLGFCMLIFSIYSFMTIYNKKTEKII